MRASMRCIILLSVLPFILGAAVNDITKYVADTFACSGDKFAGLSIGVVHNGAVKYADGLGVTKRNLNPAVAVTKDTRFGIGGLTKAFTATMLSDLLKRDITRRFRYLFADKTFPNGTNYPKEKLFSSNIRSYFANPRDMLSHRMGYRGHNYMRLNPLTQDNFKERMKALSALKESYFRDYYRYNNVMYDYLAAFVKYHTGKTWEDEIQARIFNMLSMTSSTFFSSVSNSITDFATGYMDIYGQHYEVPIAFQKKWHQAGGAGSILSTANDMAKWMIFNLDPSTVPNITDVDECHKKWNRIQKSYIEEYFMKPNVPHSLTHDGYGLGWKQGTYRGRKILTHSGSTYGYDSLITLVPDTNVGVYTAVSGNDNDYLTQTSMHLNIIDILNGESQWITANWTCEHANNKTEAKTAPVVEKNKPFPRNLADYAGTYNNDAYGDLTVTANQMAETLVMQFGFARFDVYSDSDNTTTATEPINKANIVSKDITQHIIQKVEVEFEDKKNATSTFECVTIAFEKRSPAEFCRV